MSAHNQYIVSSWNWSQIIWGYISNELFLLFVLLMNTCPSTFLVFLSLLGFSERLTDFKAYVFVNYNKSPASVGASSFYVRENKLEWALIPIIVEPMGRHYGRQHKTRGFVLSNEMSYIICFGPLNCHLQRLKKASAKWMMLISRSPWIMPSIRIARSVVWKRPSTPSKCRIHMHAVRLLLPLGMRHSVFLDCCVNHTK